MVWDEVVAVHTCYILSMNSIRAIGVFVVITAFGTAIQVVAQSPSPPARSATGTINKTATGTQTTAARNAAVLSPNPEPKVQQISGSVSVATSKEKPIDVRSDVIKDWMDRLNWVLTAILVVIGALGVRYAKKTLRVIQGQLTEIQAAGKQTDQMVKHAGIQAEAAKTSAEALIHSERAWVVIDKVYPPKLMVQLYGLSGGGANQFLFDIKNVGRTVARLGTLRTMWRVLPATAASRTFQIWGQSRASVRIWFPHMAECWPLAKRLMGSRHRFTRLLTTKRSRISKWFDDPLGLRKDQIFRLCWAGGA